MHLHHKCSELVGEFFLITESLASPFKLHKNNKCKGKPLNPLISKLTY